MADFNNTISLWKRKPRENDVAGKAYPHYTGKVNVDGVVKELSVWIQTEKKILTQQICQEMFKNHIKNQKIILRRSHINVRRSKPSTLSKKYSDL